MERSRELERQRIEQLSVEERIVLALSLGERLAVLPTMPGTGTVNARLRRAPPPGSP